MSNYENLPKLPMNWVWANLELCCSKLTDGAHFSPKYVNEGYPFIKISDVEKGIIDFDSAKFVCKDDFEKLKGNCNPRKGDILFSKDGTVGKVIEIDFDKDFIVLSSLAILRPSPLFLSQKYLKLLLQSNFVLNQCIKLKTGTALTRIILQNLRKVEVPIPPLNEQKRIASKVEELFAFLDAGTESLRKIQAQLKRYRQVVLKYAFEGKLTEEWRKTHKDKINPASVLLERIKEERKKSADEKFKEVPSNISDLSGLPDGWVWTKLGIIITFEYGKGLIEVKRDKKGKVPVYGSNGIVGYHSVPLVNKPCIIVGRKGAAGSVHLSKEACWPIDTTYYITPPQGLDLSFLAYLLSTIGLVSLDRSTAVPSLSRNDAYAIRIPVPPFSEQEKIVEKIESILSLAEASKKVLEQSLRQSEFLRQSILKKAFEGKLVLQDSTDEPAETLLARIKIEHAIAKNQTNNHMELFRYVK